MAKGEQKLGQPFKFGIVGGGGWLGQTIVTAMLRNGFVQPGELALSYRSRPPAVVGAGLVTQDSQLLVDSCETIILSVRPADWPKLSINADGKLLISVMAGVTTDQLSVAANTHRIVRAMPNVAASVGYSFTPWVGSSATTADDRKLVRAIFESCGPCDEVENEDQLDYLTGLSGSGPGYPALLAEALRTSAVEHGIQPDVALRAVTALLIGTGRLLEKNPKPPAEIVREFVEYKGVIAAAIEAMRNSGFERAVSEGLVAAHLKSKAMSAADSRDNFS